MRKVLVFSCLVLLSVVGQADVIPLFKYNTIEIPITPFSNMASGYQATNPGFRAIIRSEGGEFIAGGPLTMDAVIKGYSDDASQGSAYGQLVMRVDMHAAYPGVGSGVMSGTYRGVLSICMAEDTHSRVEDTRCKNLKGNIHPERPFQWIKKPIEFKVHDGNIKVTRYFGYTGDGGTKRQLSLAVFHPAFGFAAPGKAFKDYQSPLVLDLDHNGELDLINVWDDSAKILFDLNGDGKKLRTGWVKPSDGFLFWDTGTGCVQDGTQFFGEFAKSKDGNRSYQNGYLALAAQVKEKANASIVVANYPRLKIWRDSKQDGICTKAEVIPASKLIKEISLAHSVIKDAPLNEDNEVRLVGHYIDHQGKKHLMGDVWFKQRRNRLAYK